MTLTNKGYHSFCLIFGKLVSDFVMEFLFISVFETLNNILGIYNGFYISVPLFTCFMYNSKRDYGVGVISLKGREAKTNHDLQYFVHFIRF